MFILIYLKHIKIKYPFQNKLVKNKTTDLPYILTSNLLLNSYLVLVIPTLYQKIQNKSSSVPTLLM